MAAPNFRHGKGGRVFVNEFELTRMLREGTSVSEIETADTSAFQGSAKTSVVGMTGDKFSFQGMFEGNAGGTKEVLGTALGTEDDPGGARILTYAPEDFVLGRQVDLAEIKRSKFEVKGGIADIVAVSADMEVDGGTDEGRALSTTETRMTGTGAWGYIDDAAPTTNGGVAHLHLSDNTGTATQTYKVQHSVDHSVWADLVTFATVPAGDEVSERVVVPAGTTVRRYLRATYAAVTGGTGADGAISFARR